MGSLRLQRAFFSLALAASCLVSASAQENPRVLLLGDSHTVGPFGVTLDGLMRQSYGTENVAAYAVCGASLRWWQLASRPKLGICHFLRPTGSTAKPGNGAYPAEPPKLDQILAFKPNVAIIALGSNPDGPSMDDTIKVASSLLGLLPAGGRCFWVGPPPMPSQAQRVDLFYQVFPEMLRLSGRTCTLLDSRDFLKSSQSTKDHYYGKPAQDWGRAVFKFVAGL